ncbi:uncharacterized protein [Venturia canescens]|uniref:uncharacterized protein n=1 Tax=Venturia canescens TaxID=32260 RepID=UPI001C9D3332|nr:uncharacterized protein LOC122405920 [Venturia canescens]
MTGSTSLRPVYVVGLILAILAVSLHGVQGEDEQQTVPSEVQCRPYIEKALKDLGTGPPEQSSAEDGPGSEEDVGHEEQQEPRSQESQEVDERAEDDAEGPSAEASTETDTVVQDDDAVSAEEQKDESNETQEHEADDDSAQEAEQDESDTTDSKEGDDADEKPDSSEDATTEATDEANEDGGDSGEKEADSGGKGEESSEKDRDSGEDGGEAVEENEESVEQEEVSAERESAEAVTSQDDNEDEAKADESEEAQEGSEAADKSAEDDDPTGEADSANAENSAEAAGSKEETEDEDSKAEDGDAEDGASQEAGDAQPEGKSGEDEAADSGEALTSDGEESREAEKEDESPEAEQPEESKEQADAEESQEEPEAAEKTDSAEEEKETSQETAEADDKDSREAEGETPSEEQDSSKADEAASKEASAEDEEPLARSRRETGQDDDATEEDDKKDESGEDEKSEGEGDSGEGADESQEAAPTPEEDLIQEIEIPENLRPRDHINQLLRLDVENEERERAIQKAAEVILKDLKRLYDTAIQPLETLYKYRDLSNRHFGDPEIFSKPLVLFMGPWSGGKSSIINYLLDNEYTPHALRTGAEPSPAYFNIVMHGEETEVLDGTQLAADWTFSGLQKFGQGMLDRLRGLKMNNKLLERVNIVEIPGILEIRKQVQRLFPFNDACQWFIDRADIIFLVYDPAKLDVGPETEAILDQLKGREYQTRIILNKADQVKPEELMRVQGALIWNISPLMSSAEPPIMYSTSLWSMPYEAGAPTRLLYAQERAFLRDLRSAIDKRVEHKIASARRFAVRVRNHAKMVDCYLTTYYNHKTFFGNKKEISDKIIENPQDYHIYEGLSTLTNISRYDLPDPDVYRDFFRLNALYEFQPLSSTCTYFRGCPINRLDVAIAYDLPELVGTYKKSVEAAMHENDEKSAS